jgi:hypothetical protein
VLVFKVIRFMLPTVQLGVIDCYFPLELIGLGATDVQFPFGVIGFGVGAIDGRSLFL